MPELELALVDLGRRIDFPASPDLAPHVRARLAEQPGRGRGRPRPYKTRRIAALALALLVVAIGAVMAVPQTRAAILEFFHLRGVTIERVPQTPTAPVGNEVGPLGKAVTLLQARKLAAFDVTTPKALGEPNAVYFRAVNPPGGMVSLVYGPKTHPRALFTEFEATVHEVIYKQLGPGTKVEELTIEGGTGYWLTGKPHVISYFDRNGAYGTEPVRLAGNTLVWERGPLTLRLEAAVSKAAALKIAHSVP